jgi:hypothetical protein
VIEQARQVREEAVRQADRIDEIARTRGDGADLDDPRPSSPASQSWPSCCAQPDDLTANLARLGSIEGAARQPDPPTSSGSSPHRVVAVPVDGRGLQNATRTATRRRRRTTSKLYDRLGDMTAEERRELGRRPSSSRTASQPTAAARRPRAPRVRVRATSPVRAEALTGW